jgi:hypothetical protein
MKGKMVLLAVLVFVISLLLISGASAGEVPVSGNSAATPKTGFSDYHLFFSTITIHAPSYLSGNSDFNLGPEKNLYLQQVSDTAGITAGSESTQVSAAIFSRIPTWLKAGCILIDALISLLLLYLAVTKKI